MSKFAISLYIITNSKNIWMMVAILAGCDHLHRKRKCESNKDNKEKWYWSIVRCWLMTSGLRENIDWHEAQFVMYVYFSFLYQAWALGKPLISDAIGEMKLKRKGEKITCEVCLTGIRGWGGVGGDCLVGGVSYLLHSWDVEVMRWLWWMSGWWWLGGDTYRERDNERIWQIQRLKEREREREMKRREGIEERMWRRHNELEQGGVGVADEVAGVC